MLGFAFGKDLRLLKSKDFAAVFEGTPIRASQSTFLILAKPNHSHNPRLGLVISKKNVCLAVNRNRLKRLIRESFRLRQHNLPAIDAIVLARRGADKLSNFDVDDALNSLWKRIAKRTEQNSNL